MLVETNQFDAAKTEGDDTCAAFCNTIDEAGCTQASDCGEACRAREEAECGAEWARAHECLLDVPLPCTADGESDFDGCFDEQLAVLDCMGDLGESDTCSNEHLRRLF